MFKFELFKSNLYLRREMTTPFFIIFLSLSLYGILNLLAELNFYNNENKRKLTTTATVLSFTLWFTLGGTSFRSYFSVLIFEIRFYENLQPPDCIEMGTSARASERNRTITNPRLFWQLEPNGNPKLFVLTNPK